MNNDPIQGDEKRIWRTPVSAAPKTSWLSGDELIEMGFQFKGPGLINDGIPKISRFARFYNPANIILGPYVRIDDYAIVSAGEGEPNRIELQGFNHIGAGSMVFGSDGFIMGRYSSLSPAVVVMGASDDFSGRFLNGASLPAKYRHLSRGRVVLGDFAIVGVRSVLLQGAVLLRGAALAANSLLLAERVIPEFEIWGGSPARFLATRQRGLVEEGAAMERELFPARVDMIDPDKLKGEGA